MNQQQLLENLPWDDFINYIPVIGSGLTLITMIFETNFAIMINLLTTALWIYYLEISKRRLLRYYKQQMQDIVSKTMETEPRIELQIKQYNRIQRHTQTYLHLFMITMIIQLISLYFAYAEIMTFKNPLDMACYSLLGLFVYLSNHHFTSRYQSNQSSDLFLQIRVIQGALIVLALVISKYAIEKLDDFYNQFIVLGLLLCSSIFGSYTFNRFGRTSKKSFTYMLVGAVFLFLSDSLSMVVKVQRKELVELGTSSNVLYQVGYFFLIQSVFLHVKAYNDHFLLLLRMKLHI